MRIHFDGLLGAPSWMALRCSSTRCQWLHTSALFAVMMSTVEAKEAVCALVWADFHQKVAHFIQSFSPLLGGIQALGPSACSLGTIVGSNQWFEFIWPGETEDSDPPLQKQCQEFASSNLKMDLSKHCKSFWKERVQSPLPCRSGVLDHKLQCQPYTPCIGMTGDIFIDIVAPVKKLPLWASWQWEKLNSRSHSICTS